MDNKPNKVTFKEISKISGPSAIRNFIVPDNSRPKTEVAFGETYLFEGISFTFCTKGSAKVRINFREYDIIPNTIAVLSPNQLISFVERSEDFSMESLFFALDFVIDLPLPRDYDILYATRMEPCLQVSEDIMQDLIETHAFIVKQYGKTQQIYREKIIKAQLFTLILQIGSIYRTNRVGENLVFSRQEELTDRFFKLLVIHYKTERGVSFYADKLCITGKHLSSTVKNVTGKSLMTWINETVIMEAKILLKTSDMTVLQISEVLNFPNPSFFGRFFKQYVGMTPLKYRNIG